MEVILVASRSVIHGLALTNVEILNNFIYKVDTQ